MAEITTALAAAPGINVTVPATDVSPELPVSVRLTVTTSATVSVTVIVTDPVPLGIEIDVGLAAADPVTPTEAS